MTILVTGAAGFIGSNFVKYLNRQGITDICVSDYLTNGKQYKNLLDCQYGSFITPDRVTPTLIRQLSKVFHFGAISSTTEWNGELMMERNYNYSVDLISHCIAYGVPISYSSSASVYGNGDGPLNLYAYSKLLVDNAVQDMLNNTPTAVVQGFRYFNVYGPNEWHKQSQASPYYQFEQQAINTGEIKIFEGSEKCLRDFVHVDRVCEVQYALSTTTENGIFDLGTGSQISFLQVATDIAKKHNARVIVIPFPEHLKSHYQYSTIADMSNVIKIINTYRLGI
jgi:ADP-L-glycero-D-manno-heptose 6-epimerase